LSNIETMLQTSITALASFGSVQTRVDTQKDFVNKLTDSMKAGIGSLVDADMEEASALLQRDPLPARLPNPKPTTIKPKARRGEDTV
jgi:flagellin-like hook-associated protein FlgL